MDTIYTDGTYLKNNPAWHQTDSAWKAAHILRILERNSIEPASVCEVGCGAGEILRSLAARMPPSTRFVGYEISPEAHALCREKSASNVSYKLGDMDDGMVFEVAMAIDVFEHVEDYFSFLRRLRTKGTYKVFHIPLELSVQNVLRGSPLLAARRSVGHIHHFSRETALAALEDTGYQVLDHFYTSGRTELGGVGWKSEMLKWPRRAAYGIHPEIAVRVLGGYSLMVLAR
jgi:SAM-dependent methyltransferase